MVVMRSDVADAAHPNRLTADLLLKLSDSQIESLFDRLEERNLELTAAHVDLERDISESKRRKYMLKHAKRWISRLTTEQKQLVADSISRWHPTEADWMAHRRDIQNEYRKLFIRRSEEAYLG